MCGGKDPWLPALLGGLLGVGRPETDDRGTAGAGAGCTNREGTLLLGATRTVTGCGCGKYGKGGFLAGAGEDAERKANV